MGFTADASQNLQRAFLCLRDDNPVQVPSEHFIHVLIFTLFSERQDIPFFR